MVMSKQTIHKVSVIILLLAVFCIPFYVERSQIGSFNNSAYLAGVVINTNKTLPQPIHNNLIGTQGSAWANAVGNEFIGSTAQ